MFSNLFTIGSSQLDLNLISRDRNYRYLYILNKNSYIQIQQIVKHQSSSSSRFSSKFNFILIFFKIDLSQCKDIELLQTKHFFSYL